MARLEFKPKRKIRKKNTRKSNWRRKYLRLQRTIIAILLLILTLTTLTVS